MTLYMDVHNSLPDGATAADVAEGARGGSSASRSGYDVRYINYWVDDEAPARSSA